MKYYMVSVCTCGKSLGIIETTRKSSHKKKSHGVCAECIEKLYIEHFSPEEIKQLVKNAKEREALTKS